jgi:hypothetical protein
VVGHLPQGPEAPVPKLIVAVLELVTYAEIVEPSRSEVSSRPGSVARGVEQLDDPRFGVVVQELIDALDDPGIGSPKDQGLRAGEGDSASGWPCL